MDAIATRWASRILGLAVCSTLWAALACGENWIANGNFESDRPLGWVGAVVDHQVVHAGHGALRLDSGGDRAEASARCVPPIEVNQRHPEPIQAACWLRFDAQRQTGPLRAGLTFRVEMADGTALAWYAPFELAPAEMGSWVYCEQRWVPKAPVVRIRPSLYLRGCEGSIWADDLYLGPVTTLPVPPRGTIPLGVTGSTGRFAATARIKFLDLCPTAHVFHLGANNQTNLELTCRVNVEQPAPVYLTSAWGSQYWTLYAPARRELAQIFTDERIDLSQPGTQTVKARMNGFSAGASALAATGYAFITDCAKSFLIYSTQDRPVAGRTVRQLDTMKVELLSRFVGPAGLAAPFSLADLQSYRWAASACVQGGRLLVRPTLVDAQNRTVPLFGLDLRGRAGAQQLTFTPESTVDGAPTGAYLAASMGEAPASLQLTGTVRLATPTGVHSVQLDQQVAVQQQPPPAAPSRRRLDLIGWGYPTYELSDKVSYGPQSMHRMVADARTAGVTKLMIHARTSNATLYPSRIASSVSVGEWDVLSAAVAEGQRQGVAIFAAYVLGVAQEADLKAHPDWAMLDRQGKPTGWYCYTHPQVRAFHASLLAEIVTRYPVAGLALDYCRPGGGCFCPRCAAAFAEKYGKPLATVDAHDPQWTAWQREQTTDYLRQLRAAVRRARADALLSGYVLSRFAPDVDRSGQDWPRWLRDGIMDFVAMGVYTPSTPWFRAQCHTLRTLADRDLGGRIDQVYPLLGPGYIQAANPPHTAADAVIAHHLQAACDEGLGGAGFFPFYAIRTHMATAAAAAR